MFDQNESKHFWYVCSLTTCPPELFKLTGGSYTENLAFSRIRKHFFIVVTFQTASLKFSGFVGFVRLFVWLAVKKTDRALAVFIFGVLF